MSTDDEAAFTRLFEQHGHGVHGYLLGRTSDPEVARDLLQECFLRLWRRFDDVRGLDEGRQLGWVYTVARNLVIDRYRADATRRATLAAMHTETARTGPDPPDTIDHLATRDELAAVHEAIARLPEGERVVLTMSAVGEMTSQQIGAALDLPPGTVRYRLHRARARLAERLEEQHR